MRWRVEQIDSETRKIARAAAKAAGLPLGPWLDRAILRHPEREQAFLFDTDAAPPSPAPDMAAATSTDAVESAELESAGHEEPESAGNAGHEQASPSPHEPPPLPPESYRRIIVGMTAGLVVVMVAIGTAWLWPTSAPSHQERAALSPQAQTPQPPPTTPPKDDKVEPKAAGEPGPATAREAPDTAEHPTAEAPPAADPMEALRREAENGNPMAQHDLALAYVNGRDVPQNYQTAAEWFEKSAQAGSERAQFNLAVLYENALGVPQDFERAFSLYLAAAEQGFAPAQHNVAVAYIQGRGTSRDYRAAALWFRRAADQGIVSAQFNLGMIYERGLAGPPDVKTAYGWYQRAAAGGSEAALARLAAIDGRIASGRPEAKPGSSKPAKLTAAEVKEIQSLLNRLSFNPGPADGKPGKATRDAIRQYQQVAGLPVTGEPSGELLTHLRQVVSMMNSNAR